VTSTTDTTQHPDVSEISDLTEGLLSPTRTADVQQHLDSCVLCAEVRASLEEIRGLLGTLPGASRMPADIVGRIDAALAAEALLDATAPEGQAHVSRETTPAIPQTDTTPADRPTGHPHASTGPGRSRPARRRRAVLGAVFGAAAVSVGVLLLQSMSSPSQGDKTSSAQQDAPVPINGMQDFSAPSLQNRVQALVTARPTAFTRAEENGEPHVGTDKAVATVPPCIQKGTSRTDAPIGFEEGRYEGQSAYLVVLPHSTDTTQVQAYVIDAACVERAPATTGKLLRTNAYPRP
jgi:hypothetical protein